MRVRPELPPAAQELPEHESFRPAWLRYAWVGAVFAAWRTVLQIVYFAAPDPEAALKPGRELLPVWLRNWFAWDSGWLYNVAVAGYSDVPLTGTQTNLVFFPHYPALATWVSDVTGLTIPAAGILLAHICAAGLACTVYAIVERKAGVAEARAAVLAILLFPTSFFLVAFYAESLLLCCMALSWFFAERRRWFAAAVFAGLASGTKAIGIVMTIVLVIRYAQLERRVRRSAAWLALAPAGLVWFSLYLGSNFGDPLAWITVEQSWERRLGASFFERLVDQYEGAYRNLALHGSQVLAFDLLFAVSLLLIAAHLLRSRKFAEAAWTFVAVAVPVATGNLMSMNRYALVAIPALIWIGSFLRKAPRALVVMTIALCALLGATSLLDFVAGRWAG